MIQIAPEGQGYFRGIVDRIPAGSRHRYRLNGAREFPDPTSRSQPEGVRGPSDLIVRHFEWQDASWRAIALRDYILHERHIAAFAAEGHAAEGTFNASISHLDYLVNPGVTAVEITPVAQFPGGRNWGSDGVYPFAVQSTYCGRAGLNRFVNAAHARDLAVVLDVVYDQLGSEGYYFDPVHAVFDSSPTHVLHEIADSGHDAGSRWGRQIFVIAESDLDNVRMVSNAAEGGYGLDAQWSDDFHHVLHAVFTGERIGYYQDFGSFRDLAKAFAEVFVYTCQHSVFRGRPHGSSTAGVPAEPFVVCTQNHYQVDNRMAGERLCALVDFEGLKLTRLVLLLSPFLPMLFREFAKFAWKGEVPNPQAPEALHQSRIDHSSPEGIAPSSSTQSLHGTDPNSKDAAAHPATIVVLIIDAGPQREYADCAVERPSSRNASDLPLWSRFQLCRLSAPRRSLEADRGFVRSAVAGSGWGNTHGYGLGRSHRDTYASAELLRPRPDALPTGVGDYQCPGG